MVPERLFDQGLDLFEGARARITAGIGFLDAQLGNHLEPACGEGRHDLVVFENPAGWMGFGQGKAFWPGTMEIDHDSARSGVTTVSGHVAVDGPRLMPVRPD